MKKNISKVGLLCFSVIALIAILYVGYHYLSKYYTYNNMIIMDNGRPFQINCSDVANEMIEKIESEWTLFKQTEKSPWNVALNTVGLESSHENLVYFMTKEPDDFSWTSTERNVKNAFIISMRSLFLRDDVHRYSSEEKRKMVSVIRNSMAIIKVEKNDLIYEYIYLKDLDESELNQIKIFEGDGE